MPERPASGSDDPLTQGASPKRRLFLVGTPNVGKSVLFNALTGSYAVVSNYPGTTVEVARGRLSGEGGEWEVVDTPGMYALRPITEEERVAREILLKDEGPILHVVDAKNLPRMLPMTLELALLGRPVVLVCNLMDEARREGVALEAEALASVLGIPVVPTVATKGVGLPELRKVLEGPLAPPRVRAELPQNLRDAVREMGPEVDRHPGGLFWALRHLEGDPAAPEALPIAGDRLAAARAHLPDLRPSAVAALISRALREHAGHLLEGVYSQKERRVARLREALDGVLLNPWTGFPVVALVLYFGLYQFVGVLGGGVVVDFLEETVFGGWVNPALESFFASAVPWDWLRPLFVGEDGVLTMGLRYAVAIILPIVGTFFLAFSVLEDTGYLPRLAMLLNRTFRGIGLNGRAVIPLVLGFGCDTTATMVTRVLESKRERVIATFLLALAIPCSAQLGLILGLLAGRPGALALWAGCVLGVFLLAGTLMARLLPGRKPPFFMELPPLRVPSLRNVLSKTFSRMGWYFLEVVPLFVAASALIWVGNLTGAFPAVVRWTVPVVGWLGMPAEASKAFLFGFFRRDYGAAGLYELQKAGALDGVQLAVAAITLTLFLPCIAQFLIMKRERGWRVTLIMSAVILVGALAFGAGLNFVLRAAGVTL